MTQENSDSVSYKVKREGPFGRLVVLPKLENGPEQAVPRERVNYQSRSRRRHHRIRLPGSVVIDEAVYSLNDISMGGLSFHFRDSFPDAESEAERTVTLILPFEGFNVNFQLPASVVEVNSEEKRVSLRFGDLSDSQEKSLQQIIHESIQGDLRDVSGLIARPSPGENIEEEGQDSAVSRFFRYGLFVGLGLLLCGLTSWIAYSILFTVQSSYASAAHEIYEVRSPTDGVLASAGFVGVGQSFEESEMIWSVRDARLSARYHETEANIASLEQLKSALLEQINEQEQAYENYESIARQTLIRAKSRMESLSEKYRAASRLHERQVQLKDMGYQTARVLDESLIELESVRNELEEAEERVDIAEIELALVKRKTPYPGMQSSIRPLSDKRVEVAEIDRQISVERGVLEALKGQMDENRIIAPDAVVVQTVHARPGETVRKGELLMRLRQAGSSPVIHALVPQGQASWISHGNVANVRLADSNKVFEGEVTGIHRTVPQGIWSALPEDGLMDNQYATVEISHDFPREVEAGLPAQVSVNLSWRAVFMRLFGRDL